MFKRAFLAVRRRKSKSIILFIFLFVVSSMVLCSISIKNATNKSMEDVKKSLSSEITLSQDMSKLRENFEKRERPEEPGNSDFSLEEKKENLKDMHSKMNENSAKKSDVDSISSIDYVADVKYTVSVNGEEENFSLYETTSESSEDRPNGMMPGRMKNSNSLEIEGINTFKLQDGYTSGNIELSSGTEFEEDDEHEIEATDKYEHDEEDEDKTEDE